jgi:hypothetical protein
MTRVSGLGAVAAPARRARAGGGFMLPGAQAESASGVVATSGVAALLAVQEDGRGQGAAGRAAARVEAALAELTGLQLDLLRGGTDPARLARLAALADSPEALADPGLRAAAQGVALRVRLELARRRAALNHHGFAPGLRQSDENAPRSDA